MSDGFDILEAWRGLPMDFNVLSFADISVRSGLNISRVTDAIKSARANGFIEFVRGATRDDGSFYGSGYALTPRGLECLEAPE